MTDRDLVALLSRLVQAKSLSREEEPAAQVVADTLRQFGHDTTRLGNNAIATFGSGPTELWLNSHIDTVAPAEGYTFDPWCGTILADRVLGLGSNDAKGSVAALTAAFCRFALKNPGWDAGTVTLVASCEEEIGGEGVKRLVKERPAPAAAIVGEPNGCLPANSCKGIVLADVLCRGQSAHVSRPWQGTNAVRVGAGLLADLCTDHGLEPDPDLGKATHEPTIVNAGLQRNALPASMTIGLDCRTTPTFGNDKMVAHLEAIVANHPDCGLTVLHQSVHPTRSDPAGRLVARACAVCGLEKPKPFVGVCDFAYLAGVDAVIMGPGDPARSHKADEFLLVDELSTAANRYLAVVESYFSE